MLRERFQLRTKNKRALCALALVTVIKWFFTQAVASERQLTIATIPHRKREHSYRAFKSVADTPVRKTRKQGLGVGVTTPRKCPVRRFQ